MIQTPIGDSCPACGSRQFRTLLRGTDRLYHTTQKTFFVVECQGCQLLRMYPWPVLDELRTYYPDQYWFSAGESTAGRMEEIYRRFVLRDHVGFVMKAIEAAGPGPVLDAGAGGGLFPKMLRERGVKAYGLDISPEAARIAWQRNTVPSFCGHLPSAPVKPGSLAVLTMFHVLEHLYDPSAYLQAAHDLLRPGGRIVVQVPNAASWQFLLFGEAWNGIDLPRHLIDFRAKDLCALLEYCGFEIARMKYFSLRDNPAGLASSIAPGLDPMARRVRRVKETNGMRLLKDVVYLGLVLGAVPFTLLEAACRAGSTVMVEARKKG